MNRVLGLLFVVLVLVGSGACSSSGRVATPSPSPAPPADAVRDPDRLPTPAELVAAHVAAVGGEKAIRRHSSMQAIGTFEMPSMGLSGDIELHNAAPDRMLVRVKLPGVGEILQGHDGEVAWQDNPMTGPTIMEGEARSDFLRQADFFPELNYAKTYPAMETVERTEFDGQEAYKLRCEDTSGKESFHYFAADSGLLLGFEGDQETEMGRVYATSKFGGYKEFGGRLVATQLFQSAMGMEQTMTLNEVEFDGVSADTFALPDNIKTLAAKE